MYHTNGTKDSKKGVMNSIVGVQKKVGNNQSDRKQDLGAVILCKALFDFFSNDEMLYVGEIKDLNHIDGVAVTIGFNVAGAPCGTTVVVSVDVVDKYLPSCCDMVLDELLELVVYGEITEAEAKQFVLEAIADKVTFCQFVK